jgi:glucose-6-phosphate isomerase
MGNLFLAFLKGTQSALIKNKVDFISQVHQTENLFNLGMMIALEERIVSLLASFWKINAYDQPGVQDGKKAADRYNQIYAQIVSKLPSLINKTGCAKDFCKWCKMEKDDLIFVDAILSDIAFNINIENAHKKLKETGISVERSWIGKYWEYKIEQADAAGG